MNQETPSTADKPPGWERIAVRNRLWLVLGLGVLANLLVSSSAWGKETFQLERFWRYQPVIGEWLSQGQGLVEIPEYLEGSDLPYSKRPYAEEVPFADHLSVVRLLGGWVTREGPQLGGGAAADLVYRGEDGELAYRWELLASRLDPYLIDSGYRELMLVLDNIPYCLVSETNIKKYGQVAPPADFREWETFIRVLCEELVRRYGYDTVRHFRFRVGTETNAVGRFGGTQEDYFRHYDHAAKAIREVLPEAQIGPGNICWIDDMDTNPEMHNTNYIALASHASWGTNFATGKRGSPLDFLGTSYYYKGERGLESLDPEHPLYMPVQRAYVERMRQENPRFADLPFEIHEFGVLRNQHELPSSEPGSYGAALLANTIVSFLEHGGDRLWHWHNSPLDSLDARHHLLTAQGWVYLVLEQMAGGRAFPVKVDNPRPLGGQVRALGVVEPGRVMILAGHFQPRRELEVEGAAPVTLRLPRSLFDADTIGIQIRIAQVDSGNAAHDVIYRDLRERGEIWETYARPGDSAPYVAPVSVMATPEGHQHVIRNFADYLESMADSRTLKPAEIPMELSEQEVVLRMELPLNSVRWIVMEGEPLSEQVERVSSEDTALAFGKHHAHLGIIRFPAETTRTSPAYGRLKLYVNGGATSAAFGFSIRESESGEWTFLERVQKRLVPGSLLEVDIPVRWLDGRAVEIRIEPMTPLIDGITFQGGQFDNRPVLKVTRTIP